MTVEADRALRARNQLERTITELVAATDPDAVRAVPIFPGAGTTVRRPEPLAALPAALLLHRIAGGIARQLAADARGAGASWQQIADTARIEPDGEPWQRVDAVYGWVAGPSVDTFHGPAVAWRCSTCNGLVIDHGPYDPHPDDQERGHTPNCTRHHTAIAAHNARWDDPDDQDYDEHQAGGDDLHDRQEGSSDG